VARKYPQLHRPQPRVVTACQPPLGEATVVIAKRYADRALHRALVQRQLVHPDCEFGDERLDDHSAQRAPMALSRPHRSVAHVIPQSRQNAPNSVKLVSGRLQCEAAKPSFAPGVHTRDLMR
jgi:hypothetical protein